MQKTGTIQKERPCRKDQKQMEQIKSKENRKEKKKKRVNNQADAGAK